MDSLLLSDELFWDGKMELLSPLNTNVFLINGTTTIINNTNHFLEDSFLNESWDSKTGTPPSLLHNIFVSDNDFILPFPSAANGEFPMDIKITDTTDLHKNILTQLTPPQSPPRSSPSAKDSSHQSLNFNDASSYTLAVSPTCSNLSHVSKESDSEHFADNIWNGNNSSESLSSFSQMVDEIVSTRAKELNDYSDSISLLLPPVLSLLDNSYLSNSVSTTSSTSCSPVHVIENCSDTSSPIPTSKKCTRVYERRTEDRRVRKKEQNKNAATRYRLKKKQEMEYVLSEEQILSNRNLELKKELADRKREAKYLKGLICEFYKSKK